MSASDVEIQRAQIKASVNRALDADDIKALRAATYCHLIEDTKGEGSIRCVKERKTDGYDDPLTHYIFVGSRTRDYDKGSSINQRHLNSWLAYDNDQVWVTVRDLLHVGDVLTLDWIAANNNQTADELHLYNDEVRLEVMRGERKMLFMLDTRLCPDNTARMCQRR